MNTLSKTQLLSVMILSGSAFMSGAAHSTDSTLFESEHQLKVAAIQNAPGSTLSKNDVLHAKTEHRTEDTEALRHLNQRNTDMAASADQSLSDAQILHNFRVMGHVLDTIATDYYVKTEEYDHINEY